MRLPEALALCLLLASCASQGEKSAPSGKRPVAAVSAEARTNLQLAEGYLTKGDLAKAAERAELAIKAQPDWAQAHAMRGLVYERAGDAAKAGRAFDRALALDPADGQVLNAHAAWLCGQGRADAADREFAKALADPGYQAPAQALAIDGNCVV